MGPGDRWVKTDKNEGIISLGDGATNTIYKIELPSPPVRPGQLPRRSQGFVGRPSELRRLQRVLDSRAGSGIGIVVGLPGIGKTALAIEAGHVALERGGFGGGQLFLDLRGYDPVPLSAHNALGELLRDLGVPANDIHAEEQAREKQFLSELAQRKEPLLIVLDNVHDVSQVKPLLPGGGPHRVLLTSRNTLPQLDEPTVNLDVLSAEESVKLIERFLCRKSADDKRIQDEPALATEVARLCGYLPLALRIAAALLADSTLAKLAGELAAHGTRLNRLDDKVNAIRTAFDLSYQRLGEEEARLFRLLSLNGSPAISLAAAAAVAGLPEETANMLLGRLTAAHLIDHHIDQARWTMHDLLWEYAALEIDGESKRSRKQALKRLLCYYRQACTAEHESDWFDVERTNLVAAVRAAAESGHDTVAIELADYLSPRLDWDDRITTGRAHLVIARRRRNKAGEADALASLGFSFQKISRFAEAADHYEQALAIDRALHKISWHRFTRKAAK